MKERRFFRACALAASTFLSVGAAQAVVANVVLDGASYQDQNKKSSDSDKNKDKGKAATANLSEGERQLGKKVQDAKDPAAKLQAAGELIKKYPASSLRPQLADYLAGQVIGVQDVAQRTALAELYLTTFNQPAEADLINPALIDAYITGNRLEDAFRVAGPWLERNPGEVNAFMRLAVLGIEQVRRSNPQFRQQSQQYAVRAIELMEGDKKPATMDDAQWAQFKSQWLPQLHQSLAILALTAGDNAEARTRLEKAATLGIGDPTTYALMANIYEKDYETLATAYKAATPGPQQEAALQKALAQLDRVVELYAQAIALTEGRAEYQPMREQLMPAFTNYYKYRHKNSTDGMQQFIDKYKKAPAKQ